MGQYREWLLYRQIDQQLRDQIAELEQDLDNLQEQIRSTEVLDFYTDNTVIQALQQHLQTPQPEVVATEKPANNAIFATQETGNQETIARENAPAETISTALFAWGTLPNLNTQFHGPLPKANTLSSLPATPNPDLDLLPEDLNSFLKQYHQAITPLFREPTAHPPTDIQNPEDPSSNRTNQLVQRWMDRWKKPQAETQVLHEGNHE